MSFYCDECSVALEAEELVDDGDGNDTACPYCSTPIPELEGDEEATND